MKKKSIVIGIIVVVIVILGIIGIVNINNDNGSIETKISDTNVENTQIIINVYDKDSIEIYNETINTEETYLADVLETLDELNVEMEDSDYGMYITSILDIEEGDNYYWSYYIDDEYASVGVSSCVIEDDVTYSFKIEKYEY